MNASRRPLIAGNWKMNQGGTTAAALAADVAKRTAEHAGVDVVVGPPFTALASVAKAVEGTRVTVAAQNMYPKDGGAFTGEVTATMILEAGAKWVIVGHSERRQYFKESDAFVAEKMVAAMAKNLRPIACVGETLEEREAGDTLKVVGRQLDALTKGLAERPGYGVIAYEPIWAIGTGKTATPEMAQETVAVVREALRDSFGDAANAVRILYGGSVKSGNIDALMAQPDIDGVLVGGASLDAQEFARIVRFREPV
jgi:triosephosphate isomerase